MYLSLLLLVSSFSRNQSIRPQFCHSTFLPLFLLSSSQSYTIYTLGSLRSPRTTGASLQSWWFVVEKKNCPHVCVYCCFISEIFTHVFVVSRLGWNLLRDQPKKRPVSRATNLLRLMNRWVTELTRWVGKFIFLPVRLLEWRTRGLCSGKLEATATRAHVCFFHLHLFRFSAQLYLKFAYRRADLRFRVRSTMITGNRIDQ